MVASLGCDARDPGAPTTYVKDIDGRPLRGNVGDPRAPITYVEDVDGGPPWEAMSEIQVGPPPMLKTSMVGPLGGDAGDPEAPTTYV
jgi:hypothetical protein